MKGFIFVVLLLFIINVNAEEKNIELKVIYEKTFDEPIVDAIFDTATVTVEEAKKMGWKEEAFEGKDKVLVSYPRVVLVSRGRELSWDPQGRRNSYFTKEVRFYDRDGKITKKLSLKEFGEDNICFSPHKKYILVARIPTEWAPEYSGGTLYDLNGKKIWEIEGPTPIAVSDEGYAVAAYLDWEVPPAPGGDFYIYDSKGELIATIENPLKEKTAPLFAKFSNEGEYILLGFLQETYPPAIFILITKEGKILWRKDFLEYDYTPWDAEINILPGVGVAGCIYKGGENAFYIDWEGNLKWIIPLKTLGYCCCVFDTIRGNIYFSSSSGYLWCFDKDTGNLIWKQTIREEGNYFTEMYLFNENLILKGAHAGQVTWFSSQVFVVDIETGKVKNKIKYPKEIFLIPHDSIIFVVDATNNKKIDALKIKEE